MLAGRPLIAHAHYAIAPFCDAVVVCGREWSGLQALADLPGPGRGPLGGVAAALAHAEHTGFASVLTIACDMPEVPEALLAALVAAVPSYCEEAPVLGHWPARSRELHALLVSACAPSAPSVRAWARDIGATAIPSAPLRNINTPADLLA